MYRTGVEQNPLLRVGLVGHWVGGGAGLTWFDRSGKGNHGTLVNGPLWTAGKGSKRDALSFDGVNDYVSTTRLAGVTSTTPFSIHVWVKASSNTTGQMIVGTAREGVDYDGIWFQWAFNGAANVVGFSLNTGASSETIYTAAALTLNTWYNLIATYDGSQTIGGMFIYVNGVAVSTSIDADGGFGSFTDRAWRIGTDSHTSPADYFNGTLDDVRIYNRALSPAEVNLLAGGTLRIQPRKRRVARWLGGTPSIPLSVAGVVESLRTGVTDPHTWSHDQGTTAPKGVIVMAMHGTSSTDHVVSVSYGGVALTRIQRNVDTATEPGAAEIWFLGSDIPTGTQTVSADLASATTDDIHFVSITLNGGDNLEVVDQDGISENAANPSVTLQYAGRTCMAFAALYSGLATIASLAAGTDCTFFTTQELAGNFTSGGFRQTTEGSADFAMAVTALSDDVAYAAIAVSRVIRRSLIINSYMRFYQPFLVR